MEITATDGAKNIQLEENDMDIAGISQAMAANYENSKVGKETEKKNTESICPLP